MKLEIEAYWLLMLLGFGVLISCGGESGGKVICTKNGYEASDGECVKQIDTDSADRNQEDSSSDDSDSFKDSTGDSDDSRNDSDDSQADLSEDQQTDENPNVQEWLVGNWQYHWGEPTYEENRRTEERYFDGMEGGSRSLFLNADGTFQFEAFGELKTIYDACYLLAYQGTYDVEGPVQCEEGECLKVTLRGQEFTQTQNCDGSSFTPDSGPPTRKFWVQLRREMHTQFRYKQQGGTWTSRTYKKMKMDCSDLLVCWQTCKDSTKDVNRGVGGNCSCQFPKRSSLKARKGIHKIKDCAVQAGCPQGNAQRDCRDDGAGLFCQYGVNILDDAASQQTKQCVKNSCRSQIQACDQR